MVDHNDDPKRIHRLEVISGEPRRRRWSAAQKAEIVAESFAPGAVVTHVARRHDARPQQVHGWRKDAREGRLVLPAEKLVSFAPVVVSAASPAPKRVQALVSLDAPPLVEIEAKGVVVRIRHGADAVLVKAIVRALRA